MSFGIRVDAERLANPVLPWDTVWGAVQGLGDWSIAGASEVGNPGGLKADASLETAVIISLFTDLRAPEGWRLEVEDRRGWWGDGIAPDGEEPEPIGSHLWLLENEVVTDRVIFAAKGYAEQALRWLVRDRVASRIDVTATGYPGQNGLALEIRIYGRDGALSYDRRFERLWREV